MDRWKATALVLAGILVGVVFAGPTASGNDGYPPMRFKECTTLKLISPPRKGGAGDPTALPVGWTPVTSFGGQTNGAGALVLCR
ncbi:MAG: hypothetical protein AAF997_09715 [Myxococcota bacterium]